MADVKWIKITTDIFDDEKILLIESMPDANAVIVVWFKLLCLAGKQNNSGVFMLNDKIPYTDQMLATIFRMNEATVKMALSIFEQFGMIEIVDGVITIPNWGKHQSLDQLEERKQYMKNYMQEYRQKQKAISCNVNGKVNVNSLEEDIEEEKEKKKKKNKKSSMEIFDSIRHNYNLPWLVEEKVIEWITYKTERKEPYVEQGMKALLKRIENASKEYGEQKICSVINLSMSNGYKGILFEKLSQTEKTKSSNYTDAIQNRMSVVDDWARGE